MSSRSSGVSRGRIQRDSFSYRCTRASLTGGGNTTTQKVTKWLNGDPRPPRGRVPFYKHANQPKGRGSVGWGMKRGMCAKRPEF